MKKDRDSIYGWCYGCTPWSWGVFLIVLGGYFLLKDLGYIPIDFPLWQILLILFGVYILLIPRR